MTSSRFPDPLHRRALFPRAPAPQLKGGQQTSRLGRADARRPEQLRPGPLGQTPQRALADLQQAGGQLRGRPGRLPPYLTGWREVRRSSTRRGPADQRRSRGRSASARVGNRREPWPQDSKPEPDPVAIIVQVRRNLRGLAAGSVALLVLLPRAAGAGVVPAQPRERPPWRGQPDPASC